jgi:hypothetical protein
MNIFQLLVSLTFSASVSTPVIFTAGAATPSQSTLVANPNNAVANGVTTLSLIFTARDAHNNAAAGVSVNLTASGSGNTFGTTSGATDSNGRFTTTLKATVAQSEILTANFGNSNTVTAPVVFVAGPASATTSNLVINPNSTVANNSNTLTAVLSLRDAQNNPITAAVPSFSASGASTTVASSGNTDASGQASASYRSGLAQNENAMVTAAGIALAVPMVFVAGPVSSSSSTLTANPNIIAGNGTASLSLVTTARDAQGNGVAGSSVVLSASGGNTTFAAASGTTLGDGTYTTTLTSTQMQTEMITASIAGTVNETVSVTFTGSPNATTSTLSVNPNSQIVGPNNVINATLTLKDAAANPLAGITPVWSSSGGNNTIVSSGATSATGVATATYSSTLAQTENVKVVASGLSLLRPVQFLAGSPNAMTSYIYTIPARQLANNSNIITATLMLFDAYKNAISGQTTTFSASGINTTVSGAVATNGAGLAQATYKTGTVQSQNASASAGGLTLSAPIIFTDIPAQCVLGVNPNSRTADGNSALGLLATVTNASSQPVPGIQVIFSSTGAAQAFTAQNVITTASGLASSSLTSLYAGSNTLMAQAANVQCTGQGNFLIRTPYCTGNPNYNTSNYSTGVLPFGLTISDFNGDGYLDLAVANGQSNTLSIFFGTGAGSFQSRINYNTGNYPLDVATADFNNDGKQDLVVTNNFSNTLSVFLNTGLSPSFFQNQVTYATGNGPSGVAIGDFNGDGTQDLAVANNTSNTLGVLFNTGTGNFQTQATYATGNSPDNPTASDFNGDGKQDVAVTNGGSNTVGIFLNAGAGTFQAQATYAAGSFPKSVTVGDFDGDGKRDLAITNYNSNTVGIYLGTGTGTFQTQVTYPTGSAPQSVTVGDLNGDGKQDLAVTNNSSDTFGIFFGTGTGTFQTQVSYPTSGDPISLVIGDINGDGKQDLAVTNTSNTFDLYLAVCP